MAGFGWVYQGSGKGVTGGEVLNDGKNRLGRHETGYWGTELNCEYIRSHRCHTLLCWGLNCVELGQGVALDKKRLVIMIETKQRARYKVTTDPHAYGTNFGPS